MSTLPIFKTENDKLQLMQVSWKNILQPLLRNVLTQGLILKNVQLNIGSNVINHRLGQPLAGWFVTRKKAAADIYDTQDTNPTPALTLTLVSDAVVTVDLYVF
jgi:hypothetical protein